MVPYLYRFHSGIDYYHGDLGIEKILSDPTIYEAYRDNRALRNKFYHFTQAVFPALNFIDWYKQGYWSNKYIPFSIIEDNKIISNVSVSKMNILINGDYFNGIQFGTVGTLPEHRNRGLSKFLMEYVLNKFENVCDIFFLFANETVLDFYPKFGFTQYNEVVFKSSSEFPGSDYCARKLNISDSADLFIIKKCLKERLALTKFFGAIDYAFITHWHLLNVFPDNLFYVEDEDVILICKEENNQLHIWDVIYSAPVNLSVVVSKIIRNKNLHSIHYYFPPDQLVFNYDEIIPDKDSYLFVRGDFKIEERNFKFPITAQT
jgi:GNAT superfamily N-acetyltransferase